MVSWRVSTTVCQLLSEFIALKKCLSTLFTVKFRFIKKQSPTSGGVIFNLLVSLYTLTNIPSPIFQKHKPSKGTPPWIRKYERQYFWQRGYVYCQMWCLFIYLSTSFEFQVNMCKDKLLLSWIGQCMKFWSVNDETIRNIVILMGNL